MNYEISAIYQLNSIDSIMGTDQFLVGRGESTKYTTGAILFNTLSAAVYNALLPYIRGMGVISSIIDLENPSTSRHEKLIDAQVAHEIYEGSKTSQAFAISSLFLTLDDRNPYEILGYGTWEQVAKNKCLWGSDENHKSGTTIDAGLPSHVHDVSMGAGGCKGTCSSKTSIKNSCDTGTKTQGFVLSAQDNIYGKSDTVQPPAYVVNIWKRIA